MKRIFGLLALVGLFSTAAFADVRPPVTPKPTPSPKGKKPIDTNLFIRLDKNAKEARLLIPKSQLKQLRAQLDELDGADADNTAAISFSRTQTLIGGLFLSLAFVFGGVWLTRSRKKDLKPNKAVAAGAVLFLFGAFATIAFGNIGPPLDTRSITGKLFSPAVHTYKQASGSIKLEMTDQDNGVQLIVPDAADEKKPEE